jgi:hypothetical protein
MYGSKDGRRKEEGGRRKEEGGRRKEGTIFALIPPPWFNRSGHAG